MDHSSQMRKIIDSWYDDWFAVDRLYQQWAKRHGITVTILFTIYAIHSIGEKCTPRQIVGRLSLSKQTVGSALDALKARGFILSERDGQDQRSRIVRFTEEGQAYADQLLHELDEAEQLAFSEMAVSLPSMIQTNQMLAKLLQKALLQA